MVHHDVLGKDIGYTSGGGGDGGNPPEEIDRIESIPITLPGATKRGCSVYAGSSLFYILEVSENTSSKYDASLYTLDYTQDAPVPVLLCSLTPSLFDLYNPDTIEGFGVNEESGFFYFVHYDTFDQFFRICGLDGSEFGVYQLEPESNYDLFNAKHIGDNVTLFYLGVAGNCCSVNFTVEPISKTFTYVENLNFHDLGDGITNSDSNITMYVINNLLYVFFVFDGATKEVAVFVTTQEGNLSLYSATDFIDIATSVSSFSGLYPYQWPDVLGTFEMSTIYNYYLNKDGTVTQRSRTSDAQRGIYGTWKNGILVRWEGSFNKYVANYTLKDYPDNVYVEIPALNTVVTNGAEHNSWSRSDDRFIMESAGTFKACLIPMYSTNTPDKMPVYLLRHYTKKAKTSNYKTLTIDASTGAVTYRLYDFTPVVNPVQGVFNFSIRVTPQSGVLIPIDFTIIIQTSGVRFSLRLSLIDITLYGETYSRVATGATQNMWATQVNCISETTGYSLVYNNTAFATLTTEPGKWLNFEGCVVKDDPTKCMMRINGDYFQPDIHTVIDTAPGGFATTDEYCLLEVNSTSAVPLQVDFCNVYGYVTATPTGTDGTDMTEPLIDYTTADMLYTSATHEALWQVNWNAVDNPYGNVGLNPGVFVGSPLAPVITIVEQVPTLNKIPDGWHRVLVLDYSKGATQYYWYIYQAKNIYQEDGQCFTVGVWYTCSNTGVGGYSYLYLYSALSATESQATFYHYFYRDSDYDYAWYGNNPYKICHSGGAPQKMIYLTHIQSKTATPYMSKNKSTCSWSSVSYNKTSSDPKAPCSVLSFYSSLTTNTYKIRYFAFYPNDVIVAHPEVPWADKTAMENYFYKTGTMNAVDDLYNAIPGCTPIVCLDGHSYRGIGILKWRGNYIREAKTFDHHSTTLDVEGEFTAG